MERVQAGLHVDIPPSFSGTRGMRRLEGVEEKGGGVKSGRGAGGGGGGGGTCKCDNHVSVMVKCCLMSSDVS